MVKTQVDTKLDKGKVTMVDTLGRDNSLLRTQADLQAR